MWNLPGLAPSLFRQVFGSVSFATTGGLWACGSLSILPALLSSILMGVICDSLYSYCSGFGQSLVCQGWLLCPSGTFFFGALFWCEALYFCRPIVQCLWSDTVLVCGFSLDAGFDAFSFELAFIWMPCTWQLLCWLPGACRLGSFPCLAGFAFLWLICCPCLLLVF